MQDSSSILKISRIAFRKNLNFIRKILKPGVEFCSVIKGNAYGHGIETFVPLAEGEGIKKFAIYSIEEARIFKQIASPESQLIIMGFVPEQDLEWVIENNYEIFVSDLLRLQNLVVAANKTGKKANIHLELETGLNRTGIDEFELSNTVEWLQDNSKLFTLKGLCTHLAGAESVANYLRIKKQLDRFNDLKDYFKDHDLKFEKIHAACSAATLNYPESQFDMARIGIMQYGLWPSQETFIQHIISVRNRKNPLSAIITWSSQIISIKKINQGEYIGYGTSYLATNNMVIAVVPVGYAHGYSRVLSNQGRVLIRGKRVSVVGTVNMNLLMVNITGIHDAKVGDEIMLIGNQGKNRVSVSSFSELTTQLNYELLTRLPLDIPRKIVT